MSAPVITPPNAIAEERSFIDKMSAQLDKGGGGTAVKEEPPAKPAAKGKSTEPDDADTPDEDTSDEESESPDESDAGSDDAEEEAETEDTGEEDTPADGDKATPDDEEGEESDDEDAEPTDEALAKDARAALEKHGLKLTLNDVPKEFRPLLDAKMKHVDAVVTRTLQAATQFRKEEAAFRAEQAMIEQHPELVMAELLQKHPELEGKLNDLLTESSSEMGKKALAITTRDKRAEVLKAITDQAAAIERVETRADEIATYARTACTKLRIPFQLVEEALTNRLNEKANGSEKVVDLTEQEIDAVIARTGRILGVRSLKQKQEQRKSEIKGRTRDKKTVSPAAKSGAGTAVAPTGPKAPANDAEFVSQFVGKLAGAKQR